MLLRSLLAASALLACALPAAAESYADRVGYVTFKSLHKDKPLTVAARIVRPGRVEPGQRLPAVVVLHGTGGVSAREESYQAALARAGIASIAIDEWAARGIAGTAGDRPKTVMETLPDVYGARAWLLTQPDIDPARIGVMGFSFGGVATMLAATRRYERENSGDGGGFAAAMPVYPVCWVYGQAPGYDFAGLIDGPVNIVTGGADEYDDDPKTCETLAGRLSPADRAKVSVMVLPGAHHGFDKPGEDRRVEDPYGHRGRGGLIAMRHDPAAMQRSTEEAVRFFGAALKGPGHAPGR